MQIKPRVRGFLCLTAHPTGCAANVKNQIDYVKRQGGVQHGPKRVLVIGASTGYGLASRIVASFGCGADTIGVFFEKEGTAKKTASPGWYNAAAFDHYAHVAGYYAKSINGDAFSEAIKQQTIDLIKADLGQVDLVVYSLAAPRRVHPDSGETYTSVLKPIGKDMVQIGIDTDKDVLKEFTIEAATQQEIDATVAVMGGDDWQRWIEALVAADVLAPGAKTTAYTYLGEKVTHDIYWDGTIGAAKKDLDEKVLAIRDTLASVHGDARVAVLKAVVTQASAAIPVMPLYLGLLFKVMKEKGIHEGCIEQIDRLFREHLYAASSALDDQGRLRVDDKELRVDVQQQVEMLWQQINNDNLYSISDMQGYKDEFLKLFGFGLVGVDYDADVDPVVPMEGLVE